MTRRFGRPAASACVIAWMAIALTAPAFTAAVPAAPDTLPALALEPVAGGFDRPLALTSPAGDPRLFVVEQGGLIRVIEGGKVLPTPFLDLEDRVRSGGERGLLGLAFHPRYAANGTFYVNYTDRNGDTRIERYTVSHDRDRADAGSAKLILSIAQPHANHNGGDLVFGPDSMLYIGMGDGGSQGDPHGNGQKPGTLLGKMLRIDVDHGEPYAIPPDNPFVRRAGFRGEIWALGLRNPWRYCFDPASQQMLIADVGQNQWEEIDAVSSRHGGWNFGWNLMEGTHAYANGTPSVEPLVPPVFEYSHDAGCSIIGGFVYHGRALPELDGFYFYTDFCNPTLHAVRIEHGTVTRAGRWDVRPGGAISSFGEDARGELYVTCFDGTVARIVRQR
jgi:glucose/arabinose dehydrogenase